MTHTLTPSDRSIAASFAQATAHGIDHERTDFRAKGNHCIAQNDEPEPDEPAPVLSHRTRQRQLEEAKDAIRLAGIHSELELLRLLECITANCDHFTTPSFIDDLADLCCDIEDDLTALEAEAQMLEYSGTERGEFDSATVGVRNRG